MLATAQAVDNLSITCHSGTILSSNATASARNGMAQNISYHQASASID
jgi:hypothetical protein